MNQLAAEIMVALALLLLASILSCIMLGKRRAIIGFTLALAGSLPLLVRVLGGGFDWGAAFVCVTFLIVGCALAAREVLPSRR